MPVSISNHKSTKAFLHSLEVHVGQLAKKLEDKPEKNFGANTETNPKEQCKTITTRGGRVLAEQLEKKKIKKDDIIDEQSVVYENGEKEEQKEDEEVTRKGKEVVKPLPYPKTRSRKEKEKQFSRFMNIFKKFKISIPFSETLNKCLHIQNL